MASRTPGASTSFPSGQLRQGFSPYWGVYASEATLPNASGNSLVAAHFTLEEGDLATVTGLGTYRCASPGTAGASDAVWEASGGGGSIMVDYVTFPLTTAAYAAAAGFGIGSNDYLVGLWYRGAASLADTSTVRPIIEARTSDAPTADGWRLWWNFGVLSILVATTAGTEAGGNFGSSIFYGGSPGYIQERDGLILVRVTGGAGTARIRVYMNMALIFDANAPSAGITPGLSPLTIGGALSFGSAMSGGVQGAAYFDGTFTDEQVETWMMDCMDAGGVVQGALAWDGLWSTLPGMPAATWTDETGNGNDLTLAGAPSTMERTLRLA